MKAYVRMLAWNEKKTNHDSLRTELKYSLASPISLAVFSGNFLENAGVIFLSFLLPISDVGEKNLILLLKS